MFLIAAALIETRLVRGYRSTLNTMKRRTFYASKATADEALVKIGLGCLASSAGEDSADEAWLVGNSKSDIESGLLYSRA
jgi:hypothetical protein